MTFWTSAQLIRATQGQLIGDPFAIRSMTIDARHCGEGQLFIALKGERSDGHQYLKQAQAAGASAALVSHIPPDAPAHFPLIQVPDVERALAAMARYRRDHAAATRFIGITGSVGKTSTKEMLSLCLGSYGSVHATKGNYNNHLGLPLTLCNLPENTDFCVLEMGMNHAGEIAFLSDIAKPDIGIITTIDAVHLEHFADVEGIAHAKGEIFKGMQPSHGVAILPQENPYYPVLHRAAGTLEQIGFGRDTGEFRLSESRGAAPVIAYSALGEARQFTLPISGKHWPVLALAALSCISALGLPLAPAEQALARYQLADGRGNARQLRWHDGNIVLIDDAYNASPLSMQTALEQLGNAPGDSPAFTTKRRIALLGDMLELGPQAPRYHAELAPLITSCAIDGVITVGPLMQSLATRLAPATRLAHFDDYQQLLPMLASSTLIQAGDRLLCKGSHGSGVHQIVKTLLTQSAKIPS